MSKPTTRKIKRSTLWSCTIDLASISTHQNQVWDFYRQQLPDWPSNLVNAQGREFIRNEAGRGCSFASPQTERNQR
jgi:hypothetical protein